MTIGYLEYRQIDTIERLADADRVDKETEPALYELVTRVATQLGVPVPTIALSERQTPEALAVGFRPENIHLVLSRGTLNTVEGPAELEAVIAHELAHVKNRDAMVMTAVSLPIIQYHSPTLVSRGTTTCIIARASRYQFFQLMIGNGIGGSASSPSATPPADSRGARCVPIAIT